jgi:hypothetical protein
LAELARPPIVTVQCVGQEHCPQFVIATQGGAAQFVGPILMVVGHPVPEVALTNVNEFGPMQLNEPVCLYVANVVDPVAAMSVELLGRTVTVQSEF